MCFKTGLIAFRNGHFASRRVVKLLGKSGGSVTSASCNVFAYQQVALVVIFKSKACLKISNKVSLRYCPSN